MGEVDGQAEPVRESHDAGGMIGVLVGDQQGGELLGREAAPDQPRPGFLEPEAAVHQETGVCEADERTVAGTAGAEGCEADAAPGFVGADIGARRLRTRIHAA